MRLARLSRWLSRAICFDTELNASRPYSMGLKGLVAWVFGSEGQGSKSVNVAEAVRSRVLALPMPGKTESLNVAAAAAICLFGDRSSTTADMY